MKHFIFLFFTICFFTSNAQVVVSVKWLPYTPPANRDTIYYNLNKKLAWSDFKGKPQTQGEVSAITFSGFGYLANMQSKNNETQINITIYCYFTKQNSWVKLGRAIPYILNHEQHHFDITYIATNIFLQKLKSATYTKNNFASVLEKIYIESRMQLEEMQNEYDGQTKNGQIVNCQNEWNQKIENQLKNLVITN